MEQIDKSSVWVITKGRQTTKDLKQILSVKENISGYDYRISDLGNYLLKPNPLSIERTVIGYELFYKPASRFALFGLKKKETQPNSKQFISTLNIKSTERDPYLKNHLGAFNSAIARHDAIISQLEHLDLRKVQKIHALYEDVDGTVYSVPVAGNPEEQRNFIIDNNGKKIKIIWNNGPCVDEGIFNLKTKEFSEYNSQNWYGLFLFEDQGERKGLVYSEDEVLYWLNDTCMVRYLMILQHALDMDNEFYNTIHSCIQGENQPLYIEFNQKSANDVLSRYIPGTYDTAFKLLNISEEEQKLIIRSLDHYIENIGLKYISNSEDDSQNIMMKVTFLHDQAGTDSIKEINPTLYHTINNISKESEIGRYYVMEKKILKLGAI
ncbi:MAG TPA: hypothetical protein VJL89_06455 [Thermodesulfovibrionia bacterium]|nr:hypothetical protein [Thermodesulfovibrionia bacterium]